MRILIALCLLSLSSFGGYCINAKPQTKDQTGIAIGKNLIVWEVVVTQNGLPTPFVTRAALSDKLPLSIIFKSQALAILGKKSKTSVWTAINDYGNAASLGMGPGMAVTLAGVLLRSPNTQIAGFAVSLAQLALNRAKFHEPLDPALVTDRLFPDSGVELTPDGWDGFVISGKVEGLAVEIKRQCQYDIPVVAAETPKLNITFDKQTYPAPNLERPAAIKVDPSLANAPVF